MKAATTAGLAIASWLSASAPDAGAADSSGRFVVLGVGGESCGRFVEERRQGRDNIYRGWLTGYLTAISAKTPNTYDIRGTTDLDGILLWIENYCGQQPLENLAAATEALVTELMPNRQQRKP